MLFQHDGHEDHEPVPHQREEVLEDGEEVIPPRDRADEIHEHDDAHPDVARDGFAVAAQDLAAERRGIRAGHIVRNHAQGNDDAAELAEAADGIVAGEDERAGGDCIGVRPRWGGGHAAAEADPDQVDEDEGEGQAGEGHEEDFPARRGFGVVDVEVRGGAGPGEGHGEDEGEEGEAAGGYGAGGAGGGEGGVEVGAGGAAEDEEDEDLGDPGVSGLLLVCCRRGPVRGGGGSVAPFVAVEKSHAEYSD